MPFLSRTLQAFTKHDDVVDRLRRMYITRPLKPKLSHKHLSGKELEEAVSVFKYFDENRDKILNQREFNEYIKWATNYGISPHMVEDVFQKVDADGNKRISLEEFLDYGSLKKRSLPSDRDLEDTFYKCDTNEDGLIALEELRHALLLLGEDLTKYGDVRSGFARYDEDKDGLINVYEFIRFVRAETLRSRVVAKR